MGRAEWPDTISTPAQLLMFAVAPFRLSGDGEARRCHSSSWLGLTGLLGCSSNLSDLSGRVPLIDVRTHAVRLDPRGTLNRHSYQL